MYRGEVSRIVTHTLEVGNTVVPAHVPTQLVGTVKDYLSDSRCPATTTYYCYFTTIKHLCFN